MREKKDERKKPAVGFESERERGRERSLSFQVAKEE